MCLRPIFESYEIASLPVPYVPGLSGLSSWYLLRQQFPQRLHETFMKLSQSLWLLFLGWGEEMLPPAAFLKDSVKGVLTVAPAGESLPLHFNNTGGRSNASGLCRTRISRVLSRKCVPSFCLFGLGYTALVNNSYPVFQTCLFFSEGIHVFFQSL